MLVHVHVILYENNDFFEVESLHFTFQSYNW